MKVKTLEELVNEGALEGKRVFIRADMNVPRDAEGNVTDDHRLKESMPAVKMALKGGAGVMVCSGPINGRAWSGVSPESAALGASAVDGSRLMRD